VGRSDRDCGWRGMVSPSSFPIMADRNPRPMNGGGVVTPAAGNAQSSSGAQVQATANQLAGSIAMSIPANSTLPQSIQGSFFYIQAASAAIEVKVGGSDFNVYAPGTGYRMPKIPNPSVPGAEIQSSFALMQIRNPNDFPVAFAIFVGFGDFIDNRLILQQGIVFPVMKVTYTGVPPAVGPIPIDDISGLEFQDQNGVDWLALNRVCFYVDNNSNSSPLLLLDEDSDVTGASANCGTIFPSTTRTFPVSGDFSLDNGGSTIPACVIEIYNAIAPNIPL
jgi:hypothetical protein